MVDLLLNAARFLNDPSDYFLIELFGRIVRTLRLLILLYGVAMMSVTPTRLAKLVLAVFYFSFLASLAPVLLYLESSPPPVSLVAVINTITVSFLALVITFKVRGDYKNLPHKLNTSQGEGYG